MGSCRELDEQINATLMSVCLAHHKDRKQGETANRALFKVKTPLKLTNAVYLDLFLHTQVKQTPDRHTALQSTGFKFTSWSLHEENILLMYVLKQYLFFFRCVE